MPNIEIYGLIGTKDALITTIKKKMQQIGKGNEAVITRIISYVNSCDGSHGSLPFIRVCSTDDSEIEAIVDALKEIKVGIDIETIKIRNFIPAEKMK